MRATSVLLSALTTVGEFDSPAGVIQTFFEVPRKLVSGPTVQHVLSRKDRSDVRVRQVARFLALIDDEVWNARSVYRTRSPTSISSPTCAPRLSLQGLMSKCRARTGH